MSIPPCPPYTFRPVGAGHHSPISDASLDYRSESPDILNADSRVQSHPPLPRFLDQVVLVLWKTKGLFCFDLIYRCSKDLDRCAEKLLGKVKAPSAELVKSGRHLHIAVDFKFSELETTMEALLEEIPGFGPYLLKVMPQYLSSCVEKNDSSV